MQTPRSSSEQGISQSFADDRAEEACDSPQPKWTEKQDMGSAAEAGWSSVGPKSEIALDSEPVKKEANEPGEEYGSSAPYKSQGNFN